MKYQIVTTLSSISDDTDRRYRLKRDGKYIAYKGMRWGWINMENLVRTIKHLNLDSSWEEIDLASSNGLHATDPKLVCSFDTYFEFKHQYPEYFI